MNGGDAVRYLNKARIKRRVQKMAKQKILVARSIFPDVIDRLKQHFDVDWNRADLQTDSGIIHSAMLADLAKKKISNITA